VPGEAWQGMVDLHTHLLPGVDDGVRTKAEALEQLREARRQGITALVCTPHVRPDSATDPRGLLSERRRIYEGLLEAAAVEGGLPEIGLGSEVLVQDEPVDLEPPGLRLNGTPYALIEVGFWREGFEDLRGLLLGMLDQGWRPVLAHVERYVHLHVRDDLLGAWREDGVLTQVNASSLANVHGPGVRRRAWDLLEGGLVDLVASDVHGPHMRLNHMREACQLVVEGATPETARRLFIDVPSSIYQGADLASSG
jgi:protein-tyrosine phosphatase